MFSLKEKQFIASEIEKILLKLDHPEMPKKKPKFILRVDGKEAWSFSEIKPNWSFSIDNAPKINPFNEVVRDVLAKE